MKISYKLLILFTFIIIFSCNKQGIDLPIEKDKLIQILADVQLAEALIQDERSEFKDSLSVVYYQQIFDKYGVNRALFDTSMSRLGSNPDMMEEIYTQVIKNIEKKEENIKTK
jgi:hypothetical protein